MSRRRHSSRSLARYNGLSTDFTIAGIVAGVAGLGAVLYFTGVFNSVANVYIQATRTPLDIFDAVQAVNPAGNPDLQPGANGGADWCNKALYLMLDKLGVTLPANTLANDMIAYMAAGNDGWRQVSADEAQASVIGGDGVAAATYYNPGGHGHVALVLPIDGSPIQIAQAGNTTSNQMPVTQGFGLIQPQYDVHA